MNIQQALHSFWSGFTLDNKAVPAHLTGQVPDGTPFPNITYNCVRGSAFSSSQLLAFVWVQEENGASYNAKRQALFDAISNAIPEQGRMLHLDDGYALLQRGQDFLTIYNTGESVNGRPIYGGRISCVIRQYTR